MAQFYGFKTANHPFCFVVKHRCAKKSYVVRIFTMHISMVLK